jgi:hypothetical protein
MDANPQHDDDDGADTGRVGDLCVGADAIRDYLVLLGMPEDTDVYYLKSTGHWPIGKTAGTGGSLIASKRRLSRHVEKITRGSPAV